MHNFTSEANALNLSSFVRISKEKYYYFSRGIFSKKAYIINNKEKNEVELFFNASMLKLGIFGSASTAVSFHSVLFACLIMVVFGIYMCWRQLTITRKVFKNKEMVIVKERSLWAILHTQSQAYTYKELLFRLLSFPTIITLTFFLCQKEINESLFLKWFMFFMLFVMIFIVFITTSKLFFKLRTSFLGKFKN